MVFPLLAAFSPELLCSLQKRREHEPEILKLLEVTRVIITSDVKVKLVVEKLNPVTHAPDNANSYLPKNALMNPYQMHPARPISHRPCTLAAKLNGVPTTLTIRSLAEMLTSKRFMGVRRARYRQNSVSTRKLLRNPKMPMKPRHTATTR